MADKEEFLEAIDEYIGKLEEMKELALSLKKHVIELEEEIQEAKRKGGEKNGSKSKEH